MKPYSLKSYKRLGITVMKHDGRKLLFHITKSLNYYIIIAFGFFIVTTSDMNFVLIALENASKVGHERDATLFKLKRILALKRIKKKK